MVLCGMFLGFLLGCFIPVVGGGWWWGFGLGLDWVGGGCGIIGVYWVGVWTPA